MAIRLFPSRITPVMSPIYSIGALALTALGVVNTDAAFAAIRPVQMRCEYRVNPLGIDVLKPQP
jgi:hypothetical protein